MLPYILISMINIYIGIILARLHIAYKCNHKQNFSIGTQTFHCTTINNKKPARTLKFWDEIDQ